ncbi:MAG: (2Fe-2S)-binding protein [Pseudonocardia sp.]|nr:(2Fe-2S)-binding protein [Pseudonocardia sp.]
MGEGDRRTPGPADVAAVLADVAQLGPFFTVATGSSPAVDARPVGGLYAGRDDALAERIGHVRRVLGPDDPVTAHRVAASITFQGLAALLVSAPYAAVVVHGVLPELTERTLHWTPSAPSPWPLWCPEPTAAPDPAALADALVDGHLAPLVAAVRVQVAVSERILWGNAASAVAAAKRLVAQRWPASADRAARVAQRLLDTGPLAGAGELLPARLPDRVWTFRRRSCCLYYRTHDGGLCGDCVLHHRPTGRGSR